MGSRKIITCVLAVLAWELGWTTGAVGARVPQVRRCGQLTLVQPGEGERFRGVVTSEVYALRAVVPPGLTGWGVAAPAPFHGFAIFLPGSPGCVVFEIHIRVDDDDVVTPERAVRVRVGNLDGWEEEVAGDAGGVEWTNVTAYFAFHHHGDHFDDGSITLAVPTALRASGETVFWRFLADLRFGDRDR